MRTGIALSIVIAVTVTAGCNRRSPMPDLASPVAPTPTVASGTPLGLFGLSLAPPGLFGSAPGTGTAILTRQAPAGGVVVTLSSAEVAAIVPPSVTVPEGADRASFPIATTPVTTDHDVAIRGAVADTAATATLGVWAVLPNFFTWFSGALDEPIGRGGFGRLTAPTARFTSFANTILGTNSVNSVTVTVSGAESWRLTVSAPSGAVLRLGRYDDATQFGNATHPRLDVSGRGSSCTPTGSFEVRELVVSRDAIGSIVVDNFDATFEQLCARATGALRGEVRYTAGAR